jgi:hypothetical protein
LELARLQVEVHIARQQSRRPVRVFLGNVFLDVRAVVDGWAHLCLAFAITITIAGAGAGAGGEEQDGQLFERIVLRCFGVGFLGEFVLEHERDAFQVHCYPVHACEG